MKYRLRLSRQQIEGTFMPQETTGPFPSVVITGASTGIGEACGLELDRLGFRVFAGVRAEADGGRLRQRSSPRLVPLRLDVTDAEQVAEAAKTVAEAVGPAGLAGLVNNAGIAVAGPLELLPLDAWRKQFEVNLVGQVAVTQALLPLVRAARGRIVFIGSVNGRLAPPYLGPYAASKHALEAVADSLRVELRTWGILVALVEPGTVKTPIWDKSRAAADRLAEDLTPEGKALYGEDIEAMRRATERLAARGVPAERVVRAVVHALAARRPKTRYLLGADNRFILTAFKFLPDRLRDWFVRRALGLP